MHYVNIPVTAGAPSDEQVDEFARIVEDAGNEPLLVHCASASRVGAMWTLYREERGAPVDTAVREGRAIGMHTDREAAPSSIASASAPPASERLQKLAPRWRHASYEFVAAPVRWAKAPTRALSSGSRIRATALLGATH